MAASSDEGRARAALGELCGIYWAPVYGFMRSRCRSREEAEDLTQGFFASLLERESFAAADPERGRMRAFLRVAAKRYSINQAQRGSAAKRGGGAVAIPIDGEALERQLTDTAGEPPERAFDRRWALTLLETVLASLRREYVEAGKAALFDALKPALSPDGAGAPAGAALPATDGARRVAVHRLRKRFRELLRAAVADTVQTPAEIDGEIRYLMELFAGAA